MKNIRFGRPKADGVGYDNAPVILPGSPGEPTEAQYNAAGWYRKDFTPPNPPEGKMLAVTRYAVENNRLVAVYIYEDIPVQIKEYSLYKIVLALKQREIEVDGHVVTANLPLVEWAKANGLYEELVMAGTIKEDDPDFESGRAAAKTLLGFTDEQIDEVLAEALV